MASLLISFKWPIIRLQELYGWTDFIFHIQPGMYAYLTLSDVHMCSERHRWIRRLYVNHADTHMGLPYTQSFSRILHTWLLNHQGMTCYTQNQVSLHHGDHSQSHHRNRLYHTGQRQTDNLNKETYHGDSSVRKVHIKTVKLMFWNGNPLIDCTTVYGTLLGLTSLELNNFSKSNCSIFSRHVAV